MRHQQQLFGQLRCHVVDGLPRDKQPELGIVLCHGYGAPGTDLLPLSQALLQAQPDLQGRVQFLFPEAPLTLADLGMPEGRAWWPLSIQKLQSQLSAGRFHEIRETCPEGIDEARGALLKAVDEWRQSAPLDWSQIVCGGFSQGAMISVETVAALQSAPAGLVVLSGALIRESHWRQGLTNKAGLPVFQSHGRHDVVLPYIGGTWLKDVLVEAGTEVQFVDFPGGHQIPWEVLEDLAGFFGRLLSQDC